jgi:ribosomal protein S18 acetylase RimI-like enzyme
MKVNPANQVVLRPAVLSDIPALSVLEQQVFASDKLSRRQFRYLLTKGKAVTVIAECGDSLAGYVLVLFRNGISLARLYSIAVDDSFRGQGVARLLVAAAEAAACEHDCAYMRLEVRADNTASHKLFTTLGYHPFGRYQDYYDDHADAVRYEKLLARELPQQTQSVPYYEQTLDFTCGPAALMMALGAFDRDMQLDRRLELRLWREATTIFMTSGHGGCGPYGLALAAARRGFNVVVYVNDDGIHLIESVRSTAKKAVIRLVQEDMADELAQLGVPIKQRSLTPDEIEDRFVRGDIPLVLISSYAIYGEKYPHWVTVTGFDDRFVYVHDPFVDYDQGETRLDSINMPIQRQQFARMARYGRVGLQAVVMLGAPISRGG